MAVGKKWVRDPASILDYTLNWASELVAGDVIAAATFAADPGLNIIASSHTDVYAQVWLSGGALGESYEVHCHMTTNDGRQDNRTFLIVMQST